MPLVLLLILVGVPSFSVAVLLGRKFEEVVGPVMLGMAALGVVLGLVGLLWLAPYVILAGAVLGFGYLVYAVLIRKRGPVNSLVSLGFVLFVALACVLWWLCRGRLLTFWDDFSHWGLSVKSLYYDGQLARAQTSSATYMDYPPASPVLQAVLMRAAFLPFREDVALFIHGLFSLGLLVYPLHAFGWKRKMGLGVVCGLLLFFIPPSITSGAYSRLLVDSLLGVQLAFVLLAYFMEEKPGRNSWMVCLGCFVLALTKASGVGLGVLAGALILLDGLLFKKEVLKPQPWVKRAACCAGPLVCALAGWLVWAVYKAAWQIAPSAQGGGVGLGEVWQFICGNAPAYRYGVVGQFFRAAFTQPGNGGLFRFPSVVWFLLYGLFGAALYFLVKKEQRRRVVFGVAGLAVIHVIFMLGLLAGYVFVFSPGEAESLASLYRYEGTVATAVLLCLTALCLVMARRFRLPARALAGAGCALAVFVYGADSRSFIRAVVQAPASAEATHVERALSIQAADRVRALGEACPRVYVVSIIDDRWALMRLVYELVPITLSNPDQRTSIATGPYYGQEGHGDTAILPVEAWERLLYEEYDYVYLHNIDGYFTTYYRPLFEEEDDIVNDVMLQVVRGEDGQVTLRRLF